MTPVAPFAALRPCVVFYFLLKADKLTADRFFAAIAAADPSAVAAANPSGVAAGQGDVEADTRRDCGGGRRQAAVFLPLCVAAFLALHPKMTRSSLLQSCYDPPPVNGL